MGIAATWVKFVNLRIGRGGSRVDNTSNGGIWVPVLKDGTVYNDGFDHNNKNVGSLHPDTGYRFSDLDLPYYDSVVDLCLRSHKSISFAALIGWDVCVLENGEVKLIEWNANRPGFWEVEAQQGPFSEKNMLDKSFVNT